MTSLRRHPANPILTRLDIPEIGPRLSDVTSVFNPGATLMGGRTRLILRVQNRGRETFLLGADSSDGIRFDVSREPIRLRGIEKLAGKIHHVYDPRVTRMGEMCLMTVAIDLDDGCRIGIARSGDLETFDFIGTAGDTDSRNGVLFPEKIGGRFCMLERPNLLHGEGPASGETIVLSTSDDLLRWKQVAPVATGRFHYWDERIGPGTPPVKTREGWLLLYHGIATHFASVSIYQAGALLLDLDDPSRPIGRTRYNILEPREAYEMIGQVPNVVFPSGWVVHGLDEEGFPPPDAQVFVYYGAADTAVGLAVATIDDIIQSCREGL